MNVNWVTLSIGTIFIDHDDLSYYEPSVCVVIAIELTTGRGECERVHFLRMGDGDQAVKTGYFYGRNRSDVRVII